MSRKRDSSGPYGLSGISGIFLEHRTFLKKFLAKFLHHEQDIEDVAQEAYLKAYSAEQNRGEIEQPKAFLFSIAKNLALNELARKSRQMTRTIQEAMPAEMIQSTASAEDEIVAGQSLGLYCDAVATLPENCRRVYLLRKVHGLPHREIAERLGMSRSAVEKHLRTGSQCCRDYMLRKSGVGYPAGKVVADDKGEITMESLK
jgi:RNA polymerase sigma factor (sigma-70 family)